MKYFEYRTILVSVKGIFNRKMDTSRIDRELNELGAQGWELVASKSSMPGWGNAGEGIVCIFKRCVTLTEMKKRHLKLGERR